MEFTEQLRSQGVNVEFLPKIKPSFTDQALYAESWGIPFIVCFGEEELAAKQVKVNRQPYKGDQILLESGKIVTFLEVIKGKFVVEVDGKELRKKRKEVSAIVTKSGNQIPLKQTLPRDNIAE